MAKIDTISLNSNNFKDVGTDSILGVIVTNTDTTDITFDLILGPKLLHNKSTDTDAVYILKNIPIPSGSTFVWDDDTILSNIFNSGSIVTNYNDTRNVFTTLKNNRFLVRLGSADFTADVLLKRR